MLSSPIDDGTVFLTPDGTAPAATVDEGVVVECSTTIRGRTVRFQWSAGTVSGDPEAVRRFGHLDHVDLTSAQGFLDALGLLFAARVDVHVRSI